MVSKPGAQPGIGLLEKLTAAIAAVGMAAFVLLWGMVALALLFAVTA